MFDRSETSLFGITGGGVLGGVLLGILLFVGFEAAASIGEESGSAPLDSAGAPRDRRRRGGLLRVYGVRVLDRLRQGAVARAHGRSPSVMDELGNEVHRLLVRGLLDLIVILDATALALAICVLIGRGFFALGGDGLLPKVFAKTSRYDTPWVGNLMVAVGGIGLMRDRAADGLPPSLLARQASSAVLHERPVRGFILSATIGSFAIELVYLGSRSPHFGSSRRAGTSRGSTRRRRRRRDADPRLLRRTSPSPHDRSNYIGRPRSGRWG